MINLQKILKKYKSSNVGEIRGLNGSGGGRVHLIPKDAKFGHTYGQKWVYMTATPYCFWEHLLGIILGLSILVGCGTPKVLPIEAKTETITHYVDSVRWQTRDSVVLIEKSIYKDYTGLLDTLRIESGIAIAKAWADTTHNILNGTLEGKSYVLRETKVEYRDRIVERTDTCYVERPIPYEVEVVKKKIPTWSWWSLCFNLLTIVAVAITTYFKIKH